MFATPLPLGAPMAPTAGSWQKLHEKRDPKWEAFFDNFDLKINRKLDLGTTGASQVSLSLWEPF